MGDRQPQKHALARAVRLIAGVLLFNGEAACGQVEQVVVTGRGYPVEVAYQDARSQATRQAGVRFLSSFSEIESGTREDVDRFRQFFEIAVSRVLIVREDTLDPHRLLPGALTGEQPVYTVKLRIFIRHLQEEDPYFNLSMRTPTPRRTFIEGDTTTLILRATKDCWVTVWCIAADNSLWQIAPNPTVQATRVHANQPLLIPSIRVFLPPGRDRTAELFFGLATREPFPHVATPSDSGRWSPRGDLPSGPLISAHTGGATQLAEWLARLPGGEWTSAVLPYAVTR